MCKADTMRIWSASGLRIATIVAAIAAIVLGTCVLILFYLLDFWALPRGAMLCTTPACGEFAKLINHSVDRSVNPCNNFDAYVCGGWRTTRKYSVTAYLVTNAVAAITELVSKDTTSRTTNQSNLENAGRLYRSCDSVWRGEHDDLPVIREYLRSAGIVWPQRSAKPNVARTLLTLSIELDWGVVVAMFAWKKTMWFLVPYSYFVALDERSRLQDQEAKRQSFELRMSHFSAGNTELGAVNFEETTELERTFLEPLVEARTFTGRYKLNDTVADKWKDLLVEFNLTMVSKLWTNSLDYVMTFFDLWDRSGEAATHLFVSWMAVRFVSTFANKDLVYSFYGTSNDETVKYEELRRCFMQVYMFIGDLLFAPYNAQVFLPHVRVDVERIVLAIRSTFAARLGTTNGSRGSARLEWSSLKTVMAMLEQTPPVSEDGTLTKALLPDMQESFVQNWHAYWKYWSSGRRPTIRYTLSEFSTTDFELYEHRDGDFVLVPYALSFPLYDLQLVDAVKFGAFGGVVAGASAQVVRKLDDGTVTPVSLNETMTFANESSAAGAHDTLDDVTALSVLVDAYEAHASRYVLGSVSGFTAAQLLFVSWCFAKCRGHSEALPNQCSRALRHVPAFSSAFNCSLESPLNPMNKFVVR
ncbi:hypothetical protein HPB50_020612 [Hyalomma asiaticum]|uniref:Uncharacterized protein n=1 Tax=Hyalomma asiaticum TaxID=266040 RepID=A0ACB7RRY2_HYAAI|nr:hypothetical protein HPB50_020612 [Hyalomma asiaticum]